MEYAKELQKPVNQNPLAMKITYSINLKPVAIILASVFPALSYATPNVSASGAFQIDGNPSQAYLNITPQSGTLNQPATSSPFAASATGTQATPSDSNIVISAAADGLGHFGTSISNTVFWAATSPQRANTQVVLTETITNTSGSAQNINFDFNISNLRFAYFVGAGFRNSTNTASFSASITANNQALWNSSFSASPFATYNPSNSNEALIASSTTGSDIGLGNAANATTCQVFGDSCEFSIANHQQTLNLGMLASNASMEVVYTVNLNTETDTYGGSSSIFFNDPAGLSSTPSSPLNASLHFASPVPEPEMAGMMAAGMALLGAVTMRRRRKAH